MIIPIKKSIAAFIDILGITNEIKKNNLCTLDFLFELGEAIYNTNRKANRYEIRGFYFSDAFVLVLPLHEIKTAMAQLLFTIRFIHDRAIENGFVIRGGLTLGDVYYPDRNNGIFLGKAYLRAYELESKMAIYPRIIIDENVIPEIRELDAKPFGEGKIGDYIKKDDDGLYILDLLGEKVLRYNNEKIRKTEDGFAIHYNEPASEERYKDIIDKLCSLVRQYMHSEDYKIKQKYNYLAHKLRELGIRI